MRTGAEARLACAVQCLCPGWVPHAERRPLTHFTAPRFPLLRRQMHFGGVNKGVAVFATFFISALVHELLFSVMLKTFRCGFRRRRAASLSPAVGPR